MDARGEDDARAPPHGRRVARFGGAELARARRELTMVQQAVYTEPDDQSAWWYHRFVVSWALDACDAAAPPRARSPPG